ncbi:S-layer homology domain-containing protein [Anaerotalea alkaliphila]|uniref:SLH domain-containing protein n=1 Tax=Anaerotalea alkaliphila TaxID=2662126 RepID=A0A7X5HV30_9FIRM|nr:S-layer homology domain-containing protein [Anaerotalea alkaliphila]NDL67193.1 hypothetical protein [Anaerotalea alkaliphila]
MRKRTGWGRLVVLGMLVLGLLSTGSLEAGAQARTVPVFTDVCESDWFAGEVLFLAGTGIINGYPDATFRPDRTISRGEFIKILVEAQGHATSIGEGTGHWASPYVEKALEQGYLEPGEFEELDRPILRKEIVLAIHRALALNYRDRNEFIPVIRDYGVIEPKYSTAALDTYIAGIVTGYGDGYLHLERTATRAEASALTIRLLDPARRVQPETLEEAVALGSDLGIGLDAGNLAPRLGEPTDSYRESDGLVWNIHARDYRDFSMAAVRDGMVEAYYFNSGSRKVEGIGLDTPKGEVQRLLPVTEQENALVLQKGGVKTTFYLDSHREDRVQAILVQGASAGFSLPSTPEQQAGWEKALFHIANGERAKLGGPPLSWSPAASAAARLHGTDMGTRGYFSHTCPSGTDVRTRLGAQGVDSSYMGENLAAGQESVFDAHAGWMNSRTGHRETLLSPEFKFLGAGVFHREGSPYGTYYVQNFFQ